MKTHHTPRKLPDGAYALDAHGSILHFNPNVAELAQSICAMMKDLELQMLGMVEVRIVLKGRGRHHACLYTDPYYLYREWAIRRQN